MPAARSDFFGIREHFHTLVDGIYASGNERTGTFDLDHTDSARADFIYILEEAKRRNFYAGISCCFKNGYTRRNLE